LVGYLAIEHLHRIYQRIAKTIALQNPQAMLNHKTITFSSPKVENEIMKINIRCTGAVGPTFSASGCYRRQC
jgi:hypothetical protein